MLYFQHIPEFNLYNDSLTPCLLLASHTRKQTCAS